MGRRSREYIKWAATIAVVALAAAVMGAAVLNSRRANGVQGFGETQKEEGVKQNGTLANAYLVSCGDGHVVVCHEGQEYTLEGKLASDYTGVCDIKVKDGKIRSVQAKTAEVTGKLDRYTDTVVQVSGYESFAYSGSLPVYVIKDGAFAGEKKLTDLIIGTSEIRLIVAEGEACAILAESGQGIENIRVLIKNKSDIFYPNLYLTGDKSFEADGKAKKAGAVVNVKKTMKKRKDGEEMRICAGEGFLSLCDSDGNPVTDGYEGDFIVRKYEEGFVLVNEVPIETYLRYVTPSEMPTSFSYEALKAQAVCARTFAYKQMQGHVYAQYGANLDDSTSCQVYHAAQPSEVTDRAVLDTEGIVVTYEGELIDCYYYSTSPGCTEDLKVWNASSPGYLKAKNNTKEKDIDLSDSDDFHAFISKNPESYDSDSPYYRWTAELSAESAVDEEYGRLKKIRINERSDSGYILSMTVVFEDGERTYDRENDIRFALGDFVSLVKLSDGSVRKAPGSVPSACFEVAEQKDGTVVLAGGGFGHGIGMSQYGADGLAEAGAGWQDIIHFYYEDVEIVSWKE